MTNNVQQFYVALGKYSRIIPIIILSSLAAFNFGVIILALSGVDVQLIDKIFSVLIALFVGLWAAWGFCISMSIVFGISSFFNLRKKTGFWFDYRTQLMKRGFLNLLLLVLYLFLSLIPFVIAT